MSDKIVQDIIDKLDKNNIIVSNDTSNKLFEYYEMVVKKNESVNLTTITEYDEFMNKHIIDSLAISNYIDMPCVGKMMDVGSGAGFPGIPLKIAFENIKVTSIDSVGKKIDFQNEVIDALDLNDIEALHVRAEDLAQDPSYREQFDLCVSRAVADLRVLSEYCIPFVKVGGLFVAYKSEDVDNELHSAEKAIKELGCKILGTEKFEINGNGRSFVIIEKIKNTKERYPRKAGVPVKHPL